MEVKAGLSALVTGGASGIGRALSLALAAKGLFVTVVDFAEDRGKEVVSLIQNENAKFHSNLGFPSALFVQCDVSNARDLAAAFEKHVAMFGGLDICINSAGIANPISFCKDQSDSTRSWRQTVNVNLLAVIDCTRHAISIMKDSKKPGVIINVGSAAGLHPFDFDPVYSGSKGGVVMFTRSLVPYKRQGIRVNVLCPEFVDTDMASKANKGLVNMMGGFVPMEMVIKGAFDLIGDESKAGSCLWLSNHRGMVYCPSPAEEARYLLRSSHSRKTAPFKPVCIQLPESVEKIVVHTLSSDFRNATHVVQTPLQFPIEPNKVLLKVIYVGVNASDVNFISGCYSPKNKDIHSLLPLDAGFEAVGIIAAVGESVTNLRVGTPAGVIAYGTYAEFAVVPAKHILTIPRPDPEVVAMLGSGLTASIALEKAGQMESGKVVLVTAAAGGTGQFAVQLAKLAGNTVVATCGSKDKAALLKNLGVDRAIDYKAEDIKTVLKNEFPKGVDIVYESVGGDMFDVCLNALAVHGHLIVIGMVSQYVGEHGWKPSNYPGLCEKILSKSQTLGAFFLLHYVHLWQQHFDRLFDLFWTGKLKALIDPKRFSGIRAVADAVEHIHSGKSMGKVIVCIDPTFVEQQAKL